MSNSYNNKPLQQIMNGYAQEMKRLADEQADTMKRFRTMEDEKQMAKLREDLYNDA